MLNNFNNKTIIILRKDIVLWKILKNILPNLLEHFA